MPLERIQGERNSDTAAYVSLTALENCLCEESDGANR